jgi:hypothetical protein
MLGSFELQGLAEQFQSSDGRLSWLFFLSCYAAIVSGAVREFENQLEDKAKAVLEFNDDTPIILIGMIASGKSTVG